VSTTTSIEWTDKTWNPVRGCALVSEGCRNCYAMKFAHRFSAEGQPYAGLTVIGNHGPRWTGKAIEVPAMLAEPMRWRKPARVFVNSMSDLFHEDVSDEFIAAVFGVMAATPRHTYQILTKRPARMRAWFTWASAQHDSAWDTCIDAASDAIGEDPPHRYGEESIGTFGGTWPPPNVWFGVSVENQAAADERIPDLLATPAAVRFLSCEPLLGPVNLRSLACEACGMCGQGYHDALTSTAYCECTVEAGEPLATGRLDWVIVGGESGSAPRITDAADIRALVAQCRAAGVPVFVKQLGGVAIDSDWHGLAPLPLRDRKGGDMSEWPEDLRVREWPAAAQAIAAE
jgi:protein gp37